MAWWKIESPSRHRAGAPLSLVNEATRGRDGLKRIPSDPADHSPSLELRTRDGVRQCPKSGAKGVVVRSSHRSQLCGSDAFSVGFWTSTLRATPRLP